MTSVPVIASADMGMHRGGGVSRSGGKWRARLRVGGGTVSLGYYETREEAELAVTAAAEDVDGGKTMTGAQRLGEWGERWLDRRELRGIAGVDRERSCWRTHVAPHALGELPLRGITRVAGMRWLDYLVHDARAQHSVRDGSGHKTTTTDRRLSRQTVVHALRLARSALQSAVNAGLIAANPFADIEVPEATDERSGDGVSWAWMTLPEIAQVLGAEHVLERHRLVWTVAIYTGLRRSEMRSLQWRDVHLDEHPRLALRETKNGQAREVPLLPPSREALRRWRELAPGVGTAHVWRPMRARPGEIVGGQMHVDWDLGWRAHGKPLLTRHMRIHDLRHTCASHLIQGSWGRALSLVEVAQWLGHSDTGVTWRYSHLAPEGLRGIAEEMARSFTSGPRVDQRTGRAKRNRP